MLGRFGRQIALYGGVDLVFKLLQFALLPIYTRELSVAQFGVLALVQVTMFLVAAVANVGANYSVQRFYFDESVPAERRPVLVSTGLAQLTVTTLAVVLALIALAYPARGALESDYGITWLLLVIALATVLPDQIAGYALDTARLHFAPARFCAIAFVKYLVGLLLGLWFLLVAEWGLVGLFAGNLIGSSLAVPVGLWLVRRDLTLKVDRAYLATLLRFGAPFIFTAAGYWAFTSMDRWLLAQFADAVQVGLFGIALKLASVIAMVVTAFHQAWVPFAMRLVAEDPDHPRLFSRLADIWVFVLGLMALGLALFSADILTLFAPEAYWPAAPALAIGAAAAALSGTTQITSLGITVAKRSGLIAVGAWLTAAVNFALNLLLIPPLGASGAALAMLVSYLFLTGYYFTWSQRLHRIPFSPRRLSLGMLMIAAAAVVPLLGLPPPLGMADIAIKSGILALAIAIAFWLGLLDPRLIRNVAGQARRLG